MKFGFLRIDGPLKGFAETVHDVKNNTVKPREFVKLLLTSNWQVPRVFP
jgi:hypothetical protein